MKRNSIRRWFLIGGAAALQISLGTSQMQAGGGSKGPRPPGGATNSVITLTPAQQQALKDSHAAIVTQSQSQLMQMDAARTALQIEVLADNPSEAAIRAAAKTIGDIEGSLAVIRSTELAKIRSLFTADQWTQLKAVGLFEHDLFEGPHDGGPR